MNATDPLYKGKSIFPMKKASNCFQLEAFVRSNGRRGGIRTRDPLHPMQVRYQAALHADKL